MPAGAGARVRRLTTMRRTGETGCVGARIRIPLQVLLPWLAVSLVAFGAVAVGIVAPCARKGVV
jgi:hypothetical protein